MVAFFAPPLELSPRHRLLFDKLHDGLQRTTLVQGIAEHIDQRFGEVSRQR